MRVHELAKELGLKSQELLERIQKWGLDVKANPLASLDPPVVDRIRELMDQPEGGQTAASAASPHRPGRAGARCAAPPAATPSRLSDAAAHAPRPEAHTGAGLGCRELDAPRCRPRSSRRRRRPVASRPRLGPSAPQRLDPRLVSRRLRSPLGAERPGRTRFGDAAGSAASGPHGPGSSPVSAGRLFRNAARRRPPFRPHDASRRRTPARPGPRHPHRVRDPSRDPVSLPPRRRARDRTGRLPAAETRRLHVVGGNPPHDAAGRSFVTAVRLDRVGPLESLAEMPHGARRAEDRTAPCPKSPRRPPSRRAATLRNEPPLPRPLPKTQRPERSVTREEMLALMKSGGLERLPASGRPRRSRWRTPRRPAATWRRTFARPAPRWPRRSVPPPSRDVRLPDPESPPPAAPADDDRRRG